MENDGSTMAQGDETSDTNGVELARRAERVRAKFWDKLRRMISRVPFAEDLVAAFYCAMDPATPRQVKATLLSALAYFILPTDVIPDFILGLGFSDDAAVLAVAISMVSQHITPVHREAARKALEELGS